MSTPKEELAEGAKAIRAAKKKDKSKKKPDSTSNQADGGELLADSFKMSTRPIDEIIAERINYQRGDLGLKVSKETPLEEHIALLHHFVDRRECIQFWIGDLIVEGEKQHSKKYEIAAAITGIPLSTLKTYASTSRNLPFSKRQPVALVPFSHQREVAVLEDKDKAGEILATAAQSAKEGKAPTVKDIRHTVTKAKPAKPAKPAKKAKPAPKKKKVDPYEYAADEQLNFNRVFDQLVEIDTFLSSKEGIAWVDNTMKIANKFKKQLTARTASIAKFHNSLEKWTGYGE